MENFDSLKNTNQETISAKDVADKLLEIINKNTEKEFVKLQLENIEADILSSKVGGPFYVPEDEEVPCSKTTNKPLKLLAQINFAEMPHLDYFPEKGLLQFFIYGEDDLYGLDLDNPKSQDNWRIRYIEYLPDFVDEKNIFYPEWTDDDMMPFDEDTQYRLVPIKEKQAMTPIDYRFDDFLSKAVIESDYLKLLQNRDFYDEVYDMIWDSDNMSTTYCQMDGYPMFTQNDIREYIDMKGEDILLFQLDSFLDGFGDILWGDCGVANFFITKEDLKNKDFSNVVYNWDCY